MFRLAGPVLQLTNRSYEATFALSVIPAALGLLLVATALGGDARATHHHAAHREPWAGLWLGLCHGFLPTACLLCPPLLSHQPGCLDQLCLTWLPALI